MFEEIDDNVLEYCSLDKKVNCVLVEVGLSLLANSSCISSDHMLQGGRRMSKMTLGEKEQEFLEALSVSCRVLSILSSFNSRTNLSILLAWSVLKQ